MFKWWAKLEMKVLEERQKILSDAIFEALRRKDFINYHNIKATRDEVEKRYFSLKKKFSL